MEDQPILPRCVGLRASWRRGACLIGAGLAGLLLSPSASATPAGARLVWQSQRDCLSAADLERGIEQRLGRRVFAGGGELVLRGNVGFSAGFARAELTLRTVPPGGEQGALVGRRELEMPGESCRVLDESLLLVAALMLDVPKEELPEPPPQAPAEVETPRAVVPLSTPLTLPRAASPVSLPWGYELGVAASVAIGAMPLPAPGAGLGFGVRPPAGWGLDLSAHYEYGYASGGAGAVELHSVLGGVAVCPVVGRLELCAVQRLGGVWSAGAKLPRSESAQRLRAEVGALARLRSRAEGGAWFGELDLTAPLVRDRYVYERAGAEPVELFQASPIAARITLGYRFGL